MKKTVTLYITQLSIGLLDEDGNENYAHPRTVSFATMQDALHFVMFHHKDDFNSSCGWNYLTPRILHHVGYTNWYSIAEVPVWSLSE